MDGYVLKRAGLLFTLVTLSLLLFHSPCPGAELTEKAEGKLKVGVFKVTELTAGDIPYAYEKKFFEELHGLPYIKILEGETEVDLYGHQPGYWFNMAAKEAPTLFKKFYNDQNIDYLVFYTLKLMSWSALMYVHLVDTRAPEIKSYTINRYFTPSDQRSMGGFHPGYLKIRRQFYEHVKAEFPKTLKAKTALAAREPAAEPRRPVTATQQPVTAPQQPVSTPQQPVSAPQRPAPPPSGAQVSLPPDVPASGEQVTFKPQRKPEKAPSFQGLKWAVVIGVSRYKDERIPALKYAARDARAFHDWLVSKEGGGYSEARVKLLLDERATGVNIKDALFEWLRRSIDEDMVTIFFAGHGTPPSPNDRDNLFLLPYDVDFDRIAATGFPMWDVETALKRFIKAKRVVVLADACHSGGVGSEFKKSYRAINLKPKAATALGSLSRAGPGVAVLSSADDNQLSQESEEWGGGHGVFTYYLLKGLKGEADSDDNGRVNLGEIIPYVSRTVRRATRNAQAPTVSGKFDPALAIGK